MHWKGKSDMGVYCSILAYLLYLGILKKLSEKYENAENILVFLAAIVLFFFAAMRSINIGADTDQYCYHFKYIAKINFNHFLHYYNPKYGNIEIGYRFYNKFLSILINNQQIITVSNSFLQILLISIVIFRDSKDKWLSIYLYFTFCFYQTALNLTPSSIASYFIYLAFPYIENKKIISFLIFIIIGISFHSSCIIFLPLYFLNKIKFNNKRIFLITIFIFFVTVFYSFFLPLFEKIVPNKYLHYISGNIEHKQIFVELIVYIVQLIVILFCCFLLEKEDREILIYNNNLIIWLFLIETLLYFLATRSAMFSRGAFLFSPYIIIIVPKILNLVKDEKKYRIGKNMIIAYSAIIYIMRVSINNVGTTIPYKFFFNDLLPNSNW